MGPKATRARSSPCSRIGAAVTAPQDPYGADADLAASIEGSSSESPVSTSSRRTNGYSPGSPTASTGSRARRSES